MEWCSTTQKSPCSNPPKENDPLFYDEILLEDDGSDDDDEYDDVNAMYDEYELEISSKHDIDKMIFESTATDDSAEQTTLYEQNMACGNEFIHDNDEDMTCVDTLNDYGDEDMAYDDEYIDPSDEDMICDDEYYIDHHDEDMVCDDQHDINTPPVPHVPTLTARKRPKRSYLTTRPTLSHTTSYTPQNDMQMMHTTVHKAPTDSLTLIGILNDKLSVHRSCFLGFFCGDGCNCKHKRGIVQRSTEFYWLDTFIKSLKCTNRNLKFYPHPPQEEVKERYAAGDYGVVTIEFSSRELGELLDMTGCSSSRIKNADFDLLAITFPDDLPNRGLHIILFILWYYAADGCLLWRPEQDVENPGRVLAGINLAARDKTMLIWMQTELAKLNVKSNIVGQETDPVYNLNIGKRELVRHKDLFLAAIGKTCMAQIPLHDKLIDLETILKTGIIPYCDTPAASDVSFYDYLGVDGLIDPLTRVVGQDTCVLRLTALNHFLLGLGMAPVKNTRECHPVKIAAYLRSVNPRKNHLAKKYHDMCMKRIRDNMPNNVVNEKGRLHRCDLCTKSYHRPDMLIAHKVREHGHKGEEWKCDECEMVLSTKTTLRLHKFNLHSGEIPCEQCNETFENYRTYYSHKVVTHKCEEIMCPWEHCDKTFTTKKRFYRHVHNHNCAENKLQCPIEGCTRLFLRHDHLRDHVDSIHKREEVPCRVDGCDATFYSQGQEYTHYQRMHVKRHHCTHPGCEASFGKPSDLQRHVLCNHENPDLSDVLVEEEASSKDLQELVDQLATNDSKSGKRTATEAGLPSSTNAAKKKVGAMDQLLTQNHASGDNVPRTVFSNVPVHDQLVFVGMIKNSPLNATIILDKSYIEEATHVVTYIEDPSTMRTPSFLYAINDSTMHIVNTHWIADSIVNCRWMDEEPYKAATPRKDVLQDIQLTFIGNPYPLRNAIERASKVSGAHIWGKRPAWQSRLNTSKVVHDLTSNEIDPNITICIVTDEKTFVHKKPKLKNAQVRTMRWLIEVLAHQREINRI